MRIRRRTRGSLFLSLIALPAAAQFQFLTTTADGSQVYFSSTLRLKGTGQPFHGKIFRVAGAGPEVFAFRAEEPPEPFPPGSPALEPRTSNYFNLSRPEVSDDGSVIAFTGSRYCIARYCVDTESNQSTVLGVAGRPEIRLRGAARLSRNGRFVFSYSTPSIAAIPAILTDLVTNQQLAFPAIGAMNVSGSGRCVADNGIAVFDLYDQGVYVLRPTGPERIVSAWGPSGLRLVRQPVIDASGQFVVYEAAAVSSPFRSLRRFTLADGTDRELISGPGDIYAPSISSDGSRVLFIADPPFGATGSPGLPQLHVIQVSGGLRQVSADPHGVHHATISGNGNAAWYVSGSGQLYRLDLQTGRAERLIARTLWIETFGPWVPGSASRLRGAGFSDTTSSAGQPLPVELAGLRLRLNGLPVPLLSVTPTDVLFQVPWEVSTGQTPSPFGNGPGELKLETSSESPFDFIDSVGGNLGHMLFEQYPEFLPQGLGVGLAGGSLQRFTLALHENWDAPVTPQNPARPNEVVHLYATGLGRVEPPVATGQAAPSDPPARLVTQLSCRALDAENQLIEMPVLFGGIAPGLVGFYQVSLRLPAAKLKDPLSFSCTLSTLDARFGGWLPVASPGRPPRVRVAPR